MAIDRLRVFTQPGSNSEELSTSICFPLCPRTRTLLDAGGTSHLCHEQTCGAIRSSDQYGRGFRHKQASAAKAAGRSRTRNEQRLHVCAACHSRIRRLEVFVQFSLPDERARNNKGVPQAFSLPKCDVEKGVAEIGPLGLVPAAERRMVGIGRGDDQHVVVRETRDEDSAMAGRDDHHLMSHARPRQHVGRLDGVSVCVSRPALTARPAREPCEVRIKNRTAFSASIPLAATCNDMARVSIVAPPPFFELYCTLIGPLPKRPATTCAAPLDSLLNTP